MNGSCDATDVPPKYRSSLRDSFLSYWIVEGGSYGGKRIAKRLNDGDLIGRMSMLQHDCHFKTHKTATDKDKPPRFPVG